jgi:hypothetical protein
MFFRDSFLIADFASCLCLNYQLLHPEGLCPLGSLVAGNTRTTRGLGAPPRIRSRVGVVMMMWILMVTTSKYLRHQPIKLEHISDFDFIILRNSPVCRDCVRSDIQSVRFPVLITAQDSKLQHTAMIAGG